MDKSVKKSEYQHSLERARSGEMLPVCVCVRLTRICDIACDYCSEIRDLGEDMKFGEWREAVNIIYDLGNSDLTITGGEPLLVEFLAELIKVASPKGMYVSLASNGNLLTPERLAKLSNAGLDFLSLSIDRIVIDGPAFGKDLTPSLASNLDYISSENFGFETVVSTVITERNFRQLSEMVGYFSDLGIYHKFMLLMPNYPSPDKTRGLGVIDINGFEEVVGKLKEQKRKGFLVMDSDHVLDNMVRYLRGGFTFNCRGGIYELSVNNDGKLVLCPDGTLTDTTIFQLEHPNGYSDFLRQHASKASECEGCFWTCKQRLHDNTRYMT